MRFCYRKKTAAGYDVTFDNCLIKRTDATLNEAILTNCRFDKPLANSQIFKDVDKLNYRLDSTYNVAYKGAASNIMTDLLDKPRAAPPTLGCYEGFK